MPPATDITGQRFGNLVALKRLKSNKDGRAVWLCRCACDALVERLGRSLRLGQATSCGCGKRAPITDHSEFGERRRRRKKRNYHGKKMAFELARMKW